MKNSSIAVLVSLVALLTAAHIGWASNPPTTFTTYAGYQFTYVQHPRFGRALQDPDGKVWSLNQGLFTNRGDTKNAELTDSAAIRHCASLGAKLPRAGDLWNLRSYFEVKTLQNGGPYAHLYPQDHDLYERLTGRSVAQFMELFNVPAAHAAVWSRSRSLPASMVSGDVSYALELFENAWDQNRPTGALESFEGRQELSVLCVD